MKHLQQAYHLVDARIFGIDPKDIVTRDGYAARIEVRAEGKWWLERAALWINYASNDEVYRPNITIASSKDLQAMEYLLEVSTVYLEEVGISRARSDNKRYGPCTSMASGRKFYPFDPLAEDFDIVDIATSLSQICRYNGHTRFHYSVAQHCVLCARKLRQEGHPKPVVLRALLHDLAEAYMGDVVRPLRNHPTLRSTYQRVEHRILTVASKLYGFPYTPPHEIAPTYGAAPDGSKKEVEDIIQTVDDRMLYTEKPQVLDSRVQWPETETQGYDDVIIEPWRIEDARERFLEMFRSLAA